MREKHSQASYQMLGFVDIYIPFKKLFEEIDKRLENFKPYSLIILFCKFPSVIKFPCKQACIRSNKLKILFLIKLSSTIFKYDMQTNSLC